MEGPSKGVGPSMLSKNPEQRERSEQSWISQTYLAAQVSLDTRGSHWLLAALAPLFLLGHCSMNESMSWCWCVQHSKHHTLLGPRACDPPFINDMSHGGFRETPPETSAGSHSPEHHLNPRFLSLREAAAAVSWKMEKVTALHSPFQGGQSPFSRSKSLPKGLQRLNSSTLCCWDPG